MDASENINSINVEKETRKFQWKDGTLIGLQMMK